MILHIDLGFLGELQVVLIMSIISELSEYQLRIVISHSTVILLLIIIIFWSVGANEPTLFFLFFRSVSVKKSAPASTEELLLSAPPK